MNADLRGKGASSTNRCWYQNNRVIALSCGIKISAVRNLVLSQSTRVTDRRTDGQTDRITTPKTALAYARVVKNQCLLTYLGQVGLFVNFSALNFRLVIALCSYHYLDQ